MTKKTMLMNQRYLRGMGKVFDRRQVLRWLAKDYDSVNSDIIKVLKTALSEHDLEIRLTAMLVATRLGATVLYNEIRGLEVPNTSKEGFNRDERGLLRAIQKVALAILRGAASPGEIISMTRNPQGQRSLTKIAQCLNGEAVELDQISILIHSLLEPLPIVENPTTELPSGVYYEEGKYCIHGTEINLTWVAAVPHLLGEAAHTDKSKCLRSLTPKQGFFISITPLTHAQVVELSDGEIELQGSQNQFWLTTWRSAAALVDHLSANTSLVVDLPRSEQWEMAVRGPDGRRYPWGNILQENLRTAESPWGLTSLFSATGEWVLNDKGMPMLAGIERDRQCSSREGNLEHDCIAATRIVIS